MKPPAPKKHVVITSYDDPPRFGVLDQYAAFCGYVVHEPVVTRDDSDWVIAKKGVADLNLDHTGVCAECRRLTLEFAKAVTKSLVNKRFYIALVVEGRAVRSMKEAM